MVTRAYLFIGFIPENQPMYTFLEECGYILIYKPVQTLKDGSTKGNVDAELVLQAMIEYKKYDYAVIVTGDGDFSCLVKYLYESKKLLKLVVPNRTQFSIFLRNVAKEKIDSLSSLRAKLKFTFSAHHKPVTEETPLPEQIKPEPLVLPVVVSKPLPVVKKISHHSHHGVGSKQRIPVVQTKPLLQTKPLSQIKPLPQVKPLPQLKPFPQLKSLPQTKPLPKKPFSPVSPKPMSVPQVQASSHKKPTLEYIAQKAKQLLAKHENMPPLQPNKPVVIRSAPASQPKPPFKPASSSVPQLQKRPIVQQQTPSINKTPAQPVKPPTITQQTPSISNPAPQAVKKPYV